MIPDGHSYLELLGVAASRPEAEDLRKGGSSASYHYGPRGPQLSLASALTIVEAGHGVIQGWPNSFTSLLEQVEGRGQALDEKATLFQAFSTSVGRSLRHPYRGENGLPLPLIHSSFDAYWRERHGRRRSRNPSIKDVNARRINSLFTVAALARAVGETAPNYLHGRVLKRIATTLTEKEKSLAPEELAGLLRSRSIALHAAALSAVSATDARHRLEGVSRKILYQAGTTPNCFNRIRSWLASALSV